MKKKLLLISLMALVCCFMIALSASATTYYVDHEGNLVDSTSEDIAYEYDLSGNYIPYIFLHDSEVTKIVIPDMEEYTGTVYLQSAGDGKTIYAYQTSLEIYLLDDKETKETNLATQIKEVEIHENIFMDGAYSTGTFAGYTGLEKISFYKKASGASKGGFWNSCSKITEVHFYGQGLAIPSKMINDLPYKNAVKVVFHEEAEGTLSTGGDTLPNYSTLGGWQIIINPKIKPSNESDARLGNKYGLVTATTGWELYMAVNPSLYTEEELEGLKTSHGFMSRYQSLDSAVVKEANIISLCNAYYDGIHNAQSNDTDNKCCGVCTGCGEKELLSNPVHSYVTTITDAEGNEVNYFTNVYKVDTCKYCQDKVSTDYGVFFTYIGYSKFTDGISYAITQGFTVNRANISAFEEATGIDVEFGLIAGTSQKTIQTNDLSSLSYDILELKIVEIPESAIEVAIVCGAFVTVNDETKYLDSDSTFTKGETVAVMPGVSYTQIPENNLK